MSGLANFLFGNIFLIILVGIIIYVFRQYKDLKERTVSINELFNKGLNQYLETKINEAKQLADKIMQDHGENELVAAEVKRLLYQIESFEKGTINDKVTASNSINKFKVNKKLDFEKYPFLRDLEDLGTFTEKDMNSLGNGVAIARKEYNTQAFRYNEKASEVPIQYLTKFLKLNEQYVIFDAPKYEKYGHDYEVFEEKEPEINSLNLLNRNTEVEEKAEQLKMAKENKIIKETPVIEYSDVILKPSKKIQQDILASDIIDESAENKKDDKKDNKKDDDKKDDNKDSKDEKKN